MEENEVLENTSETESSNNTESSNESTETNNNAESTNDTENSGESDETGEATTGDTGDNGGGSTGNIYVTCKCPEFKYHFFDKFLEQTYSVEVVNEEPNIMTKPLADYTPTEGLLLIIVVILLIRLIFDYGRRLF